MIRLLIADDSALMRKLLTGIFEAEGDFETAVARNGVEVLELARSFQPDVVTLDVNMPVMDGLTCLSRLMLETPCPVVMVSSLTQAGAESTLEALHLGAVDFIAKPEGTVSLSIDTIRPALVQKVRDASRAKLRSSLRLAERVRHQIRSAASGLATPAPPPARPPALRRPVLRPPAPEPLGMRDAGEGMVLVGASTGGPHAVETILTSLPADFPWPVVVAQHMPTMFTGIFAERLNRACAMTVMEVNRPTPLLPGHAYIAQGDADVVIGRRPAGLVALSVPVSPAYRWHPSVDRMVATAMQHVEPGRLLGVLLTGMGNDGAETMAELRARGGHAIAEAEETATVWGMPGDLVRRDGADVVAPLPDIAAAIVKGIRTHASR